MAFNKTDNPVASPSYLSAISNHNRSFIIAIFAILATLIVDVSFSNTWDLLGIDSPSGISIFSIMMLVFAVGQYFVLRLIKAKSTAHIEKNKTLGLLHKLVIITQYLLVALFLALVLQIIFTSSYSTWFLTVSSLISFSLAIIVMGILSRLFFNWYKSNKDFTILLYGVAAIATCASVVFIALSSGLNLLALSSDRNEKSEIGFNGDNTLIGTVQTVNATYNLVSVLLLWSSTLLLLKHYSKRIGKIKFWTVMIIPIALIINQYVVVVPLSNNLTPDSNMVYGILLGSVLPAVAAGLLFGFPFWVVSRKIKAKENNANSVKDYLSFAKWGIIFFTVCTSAGVYLAFYPPFGFFSVLITGFSTYLFLVGIYFSAISISADATLRQSIRKVAIEESRLFGNIGLAQMEREIETKVLNVIKNHSDLMQEKGISSQLTDDDALQYLHQVLNEVSTKFRKVPYDKLRDSVSE